MFTFLSINKHVNQMISEHPQSLALTELNHKNHQNKSQERGFLHIKKERNLTILRKKRTYHSKKNLSKNTLIIIVVVLVCLALQYIVSQWCASAPHSPRSLPCNATTSWRRRDQQPCLCYVRLCTAANVHEGIGVPAWTHSLTHTQTDRHATPPCLATGNTRRTSTGWAEEEPALQRVILGGKICNFYSFA